MSILNNLDNLTVEQVLEIVELLENSNEKNFLRNIVEVGRKLGYKIDTAEELNNYLTDFFNLIVKYQMIFMNSTTVVSYLTNIMKSLKELLQIQQQMTI